MPHEEDFDPVQWVQQLEAWLKGSLDNLRLHPTHATLVDLAEAQLRLGVATLGCAIVGGAVEKK